MAKQSKENYLDYVPRPNRLFQTSVNEAGHVEILTEHRGFYNKIAQKVFKKPRFSHIELDDLGTFIWNRMDGKKSIFEIGADVKNQFGEKAEPLYERLSKFMKILHDQHYIVYENKLTGRNKEA
ncbi:MAG: PqqD family protein [Lachnospiraceae bacterium]|jgi:hypothetical protein|nr:PqqD family protein [Lachnospiraceae bacterium]MCI1328262.1 PqqD family protein [Lachnospiraceae bacterium]